MKNKSLNAPKLVQTLIGTTTATTKGTEKPGASSAAAVIPPPPVQFRDPPGGKQQTETSTTNATTAAPIRFKRNSVAGTGASERARLIQKSLEEKMKQRRSQYEMQRKSAFIEDEEVVAAASTGKSSTNNRTAAKSKSFDIGELCKNGDDDGYDLEEMLATGMKDGRNHATPIHEDEEDETCASKEGGTVPMRRKLKGVTDDTSSSLSRLEAKKRANLPANASEAPPPVVIDDPLNKTSCTNKIVGRTVVRKKDPEDNYFLVERTGDCLETKSLPKPPPKKKG